MKKPNKKIGYILYARKSSDTEDRQVQSIPDQIKALEALAEREKLTIVDVMHESRSAKAPGRPMFNEMIERIKRGEANGILAWKMNRLTRNPIDSGTISWMLQKGVIEHIRTHDQNHLPQDNVVVMAVELGMANQYVRDLSVDTKRGIRAREDKGLPTGVASIGFLNDVTAEPGNRGWIVDEKRLPLIKQLLHLYAEGKYSIRQLTKIANEEMGLRTPTRKRQGGKKLVISYVSDTILKNPIYAGFFYTTEGERRELHPSLPRLITENMYNHIQRILLSKGRPRPSVNRFSFAYTGSVVCGGCGGSVTAEHKYQVICPSCKTKFAYQNKNKCPGCDIAIDAMEGPTYLHYVYYHCTKKKDPNCREGSVHETHIDNHLSGYFKENLKISKALSEWCIANLNALDTSAQENVTERKSSIEATISKKENEYRELVLMKARGLLSDEDFLQVKNPLVAEIASLRQQLNTLGRIDPKQLQKAHKAFDLARGIDEIFENGTVEERRGALSEIGSNLTLKDKKLSVFNAEPYTTIISSLLIAKTKNPRFEPESIVDTSSQNEDFVAVRSTLLRW